MALHRRYELNEIPCQMFTCLCFPLVVQRLLAVCFVVLQITKAMRHQNLHSPLYSIDSLPLFAWPAKKSLATSKSCIE